MRRDLPVDISEPMPSLLLKRDGARVMLDVLNWSEDPRPVGARGKLSDLDLPGRWVDV